MIIAKDTRLYTYWGSRREGLEKAASRLALVFDGLEAIHPAFDSWFRRDASVGRWEPYAGQPRTLTGLIQRFETDWIDPEIDRATLPGFGLQTNGWNGKMGARSVGFRCCPEGEGGPRMSPNLMSLKLESRHRGDPSLINADILERALAVVSSGWDAVWGTVFPFDLRNFMDIPQHMLRTGWMTYLSAPLARKFVAPSGFRIAQCANGASIIVTTDELFDPQNPTHLALAKEMQAALDKIQIQSLT